jgi:hypothetical protein
MITGLRICGSDLHSAAKRTELTGTKLDDLEVD